MLLVYDVGLIVPIDLRGDKSFAITYINAAKMNQVQRKHVKNILLLQTIKLNKFTDFKMARNPK